MEKLTERLNGRVLAVVVALLLAGIATVALSDYVNSQKDEALEESQLVRVWVATVDLVPGTSVQFGLDNGLFAPELVSKSSLDRIARFIEVPAAYPDVDGGPVRTDVPNGLEAIRELAVAIPVSQGDILRTDQFASSAFEAEAFDVPEGLVAVSVDVAVTPGVANFVDAGDRVSIVAHTATAGEVATAETAGAAGPTTRILLQNVQILAIGTRITAGQTTGQTRIARSDEQLTLTVALSPSDAERLIHAQLTATLYLLMLPDQVGDFSPAVTTGRNDNNLFSGS